MKKIILYIVLVVSYFSYSQVGNRPDRFPDGYYIVPKSTFPSNPKDGQFHFDSVSNKPYYFDGTGWKPFGNDQISVTESIASTSLSGVGSIKAQVAEYINNLNYEKTSNTSDLWFKLENSFILDKGTESTASPYQAAGMTISSDGNYLYGSMHNAGAIRYSLSEPFETDNITQVDTEALLGQGGAFHITSSGTHYAYANGDLNTGKVDIYSTDTAYGFDNVTLVSTDTFGYNIGDYDIHLTNDGVNLYVLSGSIRHYNLSTPFDVTTRTLVNEMLLESPNFGFDFSQDKTRLFLLSRTGYLTQYNLSVAGDLSTAVKVYNEVDFSAITSNVNFVKLAISSDGSKLIVSSYGQYWGFKTLYFTTNNTIGQLISTQNDYEPAPTFFRLKNKAAGIVSGVIASDLDEVSGVMKFSDLLDDRTTDAKASRTSFIPYLTLDTTNVQDVIKELKDELDAVVLSASGETASTIKTKYESNANTNAFTDSEKTKLANQSGTNTGDQDISGITNNANNINALQSEQTTQNDAIALNTAKNTYPSGDATKLAGIESNATADLTAIEIENLLDTYFGNTNWRTNTVATTEAFSYNKILTNVTLDTTFIDYGYRNIYEGVLNDSVSITIPNDATLNIAPNDNYVFNFVRTGGGKLKLNYPINNGSSRQYIQTISDSTKTTINLNHDGANNYFVTGNAWEYYTPPPPTVGNLYPYANALSATNNENDTDDIVVDLGIVTLTSQAKSGGGHKLRGDVTNGDGGAIWIYITFPVELGETYTLQIAGLANRFGTSNPNTTISATLGATNATLDSSIEFTESFDTYTRTVTPSATGTARFRFQQYNPQDGSFFELQDLSVTQN
ncbi:hypothetical protein [Algibacter sp. PT7-4]|uniref:hypothetical protein n=1 Tax=Algibacter ulvanivorans TaxID=3400999 RepID=UPI003AAB5D76